MFSWRRKPSYCELKAEVHVLKATVRRLTNIINSHKLPATSLILASVALYDQFDNLLLTIKGNTMSVSIQKIGNYIIGTLAPIAGVDAQGNNIPSEIKAGSLVAYTIDDSSVGTITPNPANPLQFKIASINGSTGGSTTLRFAGINDNGVAITGSDSLTVAGAPPPPPLATGFAVTYGPETDPAVTAAPF